MTAREKRLAWAVGGLLGLVALWLVFSTIYGAFSTRYTDIARIEKEIAGKDQHLARGKQADRNLTDYGKRSLPSDVELARSLYQAWLLQSVEKAGFADVNLTTTPGRAERDVYFLHSFTITGRATLEELTKWLYGFYSAPHLHRLKLVRIRPIEGSKELEVQQLTIEALALPKSDNTAQLAEGTSDRLKGKAVEDYLKDILGRNMFGPPNHAPRITSSSSQRASLGRAFRFTVKAEDSDKLDVLRYSLAEGAPEGARIDAKTGEFSWTPKERGEFVVTAIAADDGLPSKSAQQKITINVGDAPVEIVRPTRPGFDEAKHTYVTGVVRRNEEAFVWLTVRTTGEGKKLRVGDKLAIGSIDGVVAEIGEEEVVIETADGVFAVSLGHHLLDGQPVGGRTSRAPSRKDGRTGP
jgi:hypothetical protein